MADTGQQEPVEEAQEAQAPSLAVAPAVAPVRVAWAVGPESFRRYARMLQPLAVGLMDELVELTVMCQLADDEPPMGTPCETIPCPCRGLLGYSRSSIERIGENVRRWKADLIHAVDSSAADLAHRVAADQNLPYIIGGFDLADARRLCDIAADAAMLLPASQPIADALAAHGMDKRRIRLLRPGVYNVRHATCFQELGNSMAVVAGGPLEDFHAFDAVLRCFAELVAREFDCVFFVIGSGPCEKKLRQQARKLNLGQRITFIDALPAGQLARIFRDADIYITPAPQRSIDMQSLLAMAAGVPVLAAAGKSANDFLRDGETVMGFTCGDYAELTVKLSAMLDDRASARALAEIALEYIRQNHSPAANVIALAGMYREVLEAKGRA